MGELKKYFPGDKIVRTRKTDGLKQEWKLNWIEETNEPGILRVGVSLTKGKDPGGQVILIKGTMDRQPGLLPGHKNFTWIGSDGAVHIQSRMGVSENAPTQEDISKAIQNPHFPLPEDHSNKDPKVDTSTLRLPPIPISLDLSYLSEYFKALPMEKLNKIIELSVSTYKERRRGESIDKALTLKPKMDVIFHGKGKKLLKDGAKGEVLRVKTTKVKVDFGVPIGVWTVPASCLTPEIKKKEN